jgi:undecaprenyl diphosphate synthase
MNPIDHVAIIMDGNGRWGIKHKGLRNSGHKAGVNTIESVIDVCLKEKVRYLTLYTFSTENWKRPKKEIDFLFNLLENFLIQKIDNLINKNIKLKFIGQLNKLPSKLKKLIKISEDKTSTNNEIQIFIALNYGSKDELVNSIKSINEKNIVLNKKNISKNLYSGDIPSPDILIRTGDTHRLSNFMLWQLAYTEIFFEKKLWPDFNKKDLNNIFKKFRFLKRNFGSI